LIEKEMHARKWEINDFIDLHIALGKGSLSRKGKKKKKREIELGRLLFTIMLETVIN
jgi:hypothetical protein